MSWKLLLVPFGLLIGLGLGLLDSSPHWDDTGITALVLLGACGLIGVLDPKRPWLWALAVGCWVPLLNIVRNGNGEAVIALAFAFGGAYLGALAGRALRGELRGTAEY